MAFNSPKLSLIYFSPTGTTKKNLFAIAEGFNSQIVEEINLTNPKERQDLQKKLLGEIIFIAVPIYSGTIPHLIQCILKQLNVNEKWVVLIGTFGNVKSGICLSNLVQILAPQSFRILGAANCIGEHTFGSSKAPIALGRPDTEDLNLAVKFGQELRKKYENFPIAIEIKPQDIPAPKPRTKLISLPHVNKEKCTNCLKCVTACPNEAIDPNSLEIYDDRCILCSACIKICEYNAREMRYTSDEEQFNKFLAYSKQRLSPEFLL